MTDNEVINTLIHENGVENVILYLTMSLRKFELDKTKRDSYEEFFIKEKLKELKKVRQHAY